MKLQMGFAMRRRALVPLAIALVGLAGLLWALNLMRSAPGVTNANYLRISKGMTVEEAETILGEPPRYNPHKGGELWWIGKKGTIFVRVGPGLSGLVIVDKEFRPNSEPFTDKLRLLLGNPPAQSATPSSGSDGEP